MLFKDQIFTALEQGRAALLRFRQPHDDSMQGCGHVTLSVQKNLADQLDRALAMIEQLSDERDALALQLSAPVETLAA